MYRGMPLSSQNPSSEATSEVAPASRGCETTAPQDRTTVAPNPELLTICSARVDLLNDLDGPLAGTPPARDAATDHTGGDGSSRCDHAALDESAAAVGAAITAESTEPGDDSEHTTVSYISAGILSACALSCFVMITANLIARVATPNYGLSLAGLLVAIFLLYFLITQLAQPSVRTHRMFKVAAICATSGALLHYAGNAVLVNWTCLNCLTAPLPDASQQHIAVDWPNIFHSGLVEGTLAELLQNKLGTIGTIPHTAWSLAMIGLGLCWFGVCYFLAAATHIAFKETQRLKAVPTENYSGQNEKA